MRFQSLRSLLWGGAVAPFEGAEFPEFPMQTKLRMRRQEGGLAGGGREKTVSGLIRPQPRTPHPALSGGSVCHRSYNRASELEATGALRHLARGRRAVGAPRPARGRAGCAPPPSPCAAREHCHLEGHWPFLPKFGQTSSSQTRGGTRRETEIKRNTGTV